MASLKEEYKKFLNDIEQNMKNEEDLKYVKERFSLFVDVIIDEMDRIMKYKEAKMQSLEDTQKQLDERMNKIQQIIDNIEKDIYSEDGFDFEIICPYCNYQFLIDVDDNKTEIQCPECNNIIELDWTGDLDDEEDDNSHSQCEGCSGCNPENQDEDKNEEEDDDM